MPEAISTIPLMVEGSFGAGRRVGVVSLSEVLPDHLQLRVITLGLEQSTGGLAARLHDSFGREYESWGGGGGGADLWFAHDFGYRGPLASDAESLTVELIDPDPPGTSITVEGPLDQGSRLCAPIDSLDVCHLGAALEEDRQRVLPEHVRTVNTEVSGLSPEHVLLSVEQWAMTSVVAVYLDSPHYQETLMPRRATALDERSRRYLLLSDGGGTWASGTTSRLRVCPRIPDDVTELRVWEGPPSPSAGEPGSVPNLTLRCRP